MLGIIASAAACLLALYFAALFSSASGHWTRATFPWTDQATYLSMTLSFAFFVAFAYFTMKISTPNTDMTEWQKIRYRIAVFAATIGFIFLALAISLYFYILFIVETTDGEAGFLVAFPLLVAFLSLSLAALLAYSVRNYLSKKIYRWLTVPAIAILLLWSSAVFISAILTTISNAGRWKP